MVCLESFPLGGIEAPPTGLREACTPVPPPGVTADLTVAQDEAQDVDAGATYRPRSDFLGCPGTDVRLYVSGSPQGCAAETRTAPAITMANPHAPSLNFWKEVVEIKRTKGLAS